MLRLLVCSLALFNHLVRGETVNKRNSLEKRACPAGSTLCGQIGTLSYCAEPGYKCCNSRYSAPLSATCCPSGNTYAPIGNYCCTDGSNCPNGKTCRGCTPAAGSGGFVGSSLVVSQPVSPVTTVPPSVVTTTRIVPVYAYYTYTITYYYFQLYYIYVPSITRSTPTSSTVTTTTTISVYAANSADAQASFVALSATLSLPTPLSATVLPPLPSQTSDLFSIPSTTTSSVRATSATPTVSQFSGGGTSRAGRLVSGDSWYTLLSALLIGFVAGGAAIGAAVL